VSLYLRLAPHEKYGFLWLIVTYGSNFLVAISVSMLKQLQEPVSHICSVTDGYQWVDLCFGEVHLVDRFWRCSLSGANRIMSHIIASPSSTMPQ
jgi:hypothetical protein